ncbi:hypothetical protein HDV00_012277 [Rhizophlyctis rosea]|nr:hypothetical protein HDV00_012277 [Rhizophlyctis rosea]
MSLEKQRIAEQRQREYHTNPRERERLRQEYQQILDAKVEVPSAPGPSDESAIHWRDNEARIRTATPLLELQIADKHQSATDFPQYSCLRYLEVVAPGSVSDGRRIERLIESWKTGRVEEKEIKTRLRDLVFVTVLMDRGVGNEYEHRPRDEPRATYTQLEGVALAVFDWFVRGGVSSDPKAPPQVNSSGGRR